MDNIYTNLITVNYSDVAENNTLGNIGILRILQETGAVHCDFVGYGPNDTPTTHVAWIILTWRLQVFSRPKWNTKLKVNTWTKTHDHLFCYRDFEIFDEENNLIAKATSKWILFNGVEKTISRITKDVEEKYNCFDKCVFENKANEKIKEPITSKPVLDYTICRRDIDTNHHVNNLNYLTYAYEALPNEVFKNYIFNNVEIMYKHEAKLGDTLTFYYAELQNNEHVVTIKNKQDDKINAIIKLY